MEITTGSENENARFSTASQPRESEAHQDMEKYQHTMVGKIVTAKYFSPAVVVALIVICASVAGTGGYSAFLYMGAILGLLPSIMVILSYHTMSTWRKHPNPIIYYRTLTETLIALRFLTLNFPGHVVGSEELDGGCAAPAAITQFCLMASECWFFALSLDLLASVSNPFASYKRNMRLYHIFAWGAGILTTIILLATESYGISTVKVCWVKATDQFVSVAAWLLWYLWMLLFYFIAVFILLYARARLTRGMSTTFRIRRKVLLTSSKALGIFVLYWAVVLILYLAFIIFNPNGEDLSKNAWPQQAIGFLLASKGLVCGIVWFETNSFQEFVIHLLNHGLKKQKVDGDADQVDLSPQVNMALRRELLHYITVGIMEAVSRADSVPAGVPHQLILIPRELADNTAAHPPTPRSQRVGDTTSFEPVHDEETGERAQPRGCVQSLVHFCTNGMTIKEVSGSKEVHSWFSSADAPIAFRDYCPHLFRELRSVFRINDAEYIKSLSETAREKLSEGASGAFMFFTKDAKYIVKSTTSEEKDLLASIMPSYAQYMMRNPDTLLTRFYGLHTIQMYRQSFHFVVMANIFNTDRVINFRYDLKGSWVSRNADPVIPGKRVNCRHCNLKYKYGERGALCPERPGGHEPNVVLKDNDLTHKIKLSRDTAVMLYRQIRRDSLFLSDVGIMDYSLILGVSTEEFEVDKVTHTPVFVSNRLSSTLADLEDLHSETSNPMTAYDEEDPRDTGTKRTVKPAKTRSIYLSDPADKAEQLKENRGGSRSFQEPVHFARWRATAAEISGKDEFSIAAGYVVGPAYYYVGLIDILQAWTLQKKVERFFKTTFLGKDPDGLSAIEPRRYQERFEAKIRDLIEISGE